MEELATELNQLVNDTRSNLHLYTDEQMRIKPKPDKWSRIEILGHLIDSAINNLKRFTEIPFMKNDFRFMTYAQDKLVKQNKYQEANYNLTLDLWSLLNRHIAYVIQQLAGSDLKQNVTLADGEVVTLEFLVIDYVDHLKHHLNQIFEPTRF
ncbi:MAG: DinB family protein [Calditrichaeota bacterium]|nr:DinB family protein [Calditrichota bacterium]